jgi:hypothetical protein
LLGDHGWGGGGDKTIILFDSKGSSKTDGSLFSAYLLYLKIL